MIKPKLVSVFLLLLLSSVVGTKAQEAEVQGVASVSIFEVITTPSKFHGRDIIVTGVYRFDLDLATLYPSKEYLAEDVFQSSISLELPDGILPENLETLMELDGQFVRVKGTFDAKNRGFSGFNRGTVIAVKEITKHSK
jgi:kynureninase